MNRTLLFDYFDKLEKDKQTNLLKQCFDNMNTEQRRNVFYKLESEYVSHTKINGKDVFDRISNFKEAALKGKYFAPFDINSKNFMHVPEETNMWFEILAVLLLESTKLSEQGNHNDAIKCFKLLFDCIDDMESGEEIIFADEYGMWMLPIHMEPCIQAYINSAAAISSPKEYVEIVLPLIIADSRSSNWNKVRKKALNAANKAQQALLQKEMTGNG